MTDQTPRSAFSLVEVVIAVGVFAATVVAVIGLLAPAQKRIDATFDTSTANSLAEHLRAELERIGFQNAVSLTESGSLAVVASPDGSRVRLDEYVSADSSVPADRTLDDPALPGLAERDRFFRIVVSQHDGDLGYFDAESSAGQSGFLALRAEITWPYHLPVGPPSATLFATGPLADPFSEIPESTRRGATLNFALTP